MQDTFVRAKSWVKELQRQASPNIVIALAGNKSDLADKRLVDTEVYTQTSKNRLTAPPYAASPPAILSSRDRSIAGYSYS